MIAKGGDVIRVLITGGAGFIGSHLVEYFLKQNHEVVCLDNFDPYYDPSIKRTNVAPYISEKNFTLIDGDIRNTEAIKKAIEGVDYVFHEAAQAGINSSITNPLKSHDINTTGTLNLLEVARDSNVKKIICASSSSVYGRIKYLPFDEDHPRSPISPYGVSKQMVEEYCRVFNEIYGIKTVSLRYFSVYGPRIRPDLSISIFIKRALNNELLNIFGTGGKSRDFTYIDDVVRATVLSMVSGSGVYNIGSSQSITIGELAKKIIRMTASNSKIQYCKEAIGDAQHTWANVEKAKRDLCWEPRIHINEGLTKTINWYKFGFDNK